ncbi:elongation factor P maturation arginine rhamnosyltransferase EarP [Nitrosomonas sp. Is37]|uniref:elongation factor P maturation arginine rhamnosyltransferase EarP n=1 Tax=Nitrosomonas sp. Is37 TaxID=3080535 RepID=UPI00294B1DE3|nr:elongation factor P maturation arginine rhamnosyltransferase EarP [Nitrosomonas sp. Is37]MDV6345000.1 elongation factor P maturation arginine rhamnosyltransferase EarP [Nitrosomonas sp. Is37]
MVRWDIFCRVIDNYGDIGVCWRLARQLAAEHGIAVRLWVDDVASLKRICPDVDATLEVQNCRGVEVWRWIEPFPDLVPAEVVIEAFGCELPENYMAAMAPSILQSANHVWGRPSPTRGEEVKRVWINLEYLSAEQWVEGCHGLPSPHPRLPMTKYFFFPGFTPATGGLLREKGLLAQRNVSEHNLAELWDRFGLPFPLSPETIVSLFCYDSAPIGNLLDAWAVSTTAVRCLLPEGKALEQIASWAGRTSLAVGDSVQRGNLVLHVIPFMPQEDYDRLLWACDCNFVRGEDSFVRAQWAARPLIWQIYPQQDNVHQVKLNAFLDRYCQGLAEEAAAALRTFYYNWNSGRRLDWDDFWQHRTVLQDHAMAWAEQLAKITDLASNLVSFCKNQISSKNSNF